MQDSQFDNAEPLGKIPIPEEIAQTIRDAAIAHQTAGVDDKGNPKNPAAAGVLQDYQAATTPHYDGNILIPPKFAPIEFGDAPSGPPTKLESAARGAGLGATLGAQPMGSGMVEAGMGALDSIIRGKNNFGDEGRLGGLANVIQNYTRSRDVEKQQNSEAQSANPKTFLGSELVGGLPLGVATGGEALMGKGVAGSALPGFQRALNLASVGGTMGAISGFSNSKSDITKGEISGAAKDTLDSAISVASTAGLLSAILAKNSSTTSLAEKIDQKAGQAAFNSLNGRGNYARDLVASGKSAEIGQTLLDNDIVTATSSRPQMLKTLNSKLKDVGEQIGYYADQADKAVARDSSLSGVNVQNLSDQLINEVVKPLEKDPLEASKKLGDDIRQYAVNLIKDNPSGEVGYKDAQGFKVTLDKLKAKFNSTSDSLSHDEWQKAYGILRDHIDGGIANIFQKAAPELNNNFVPLKNVYGDLKTAQNILEPTIGREENNNGVSLMEGLMGLGGIVATQPGDHGPILGTIAKVGGGIALGTGYHLMKKYGNQAVASTLNTLSNLTDSNPEVIQNFMQQYGPTIKDAATKSASVMANQPGLAQKIKEQFLDFKTPSVITPGGRK